jgi:hypothetical protein
MPRIPYWLQRADLTSTQHEPVDVDTAIQVLHSHDWRAELELERERESAGFESCPPGIGFCSATDQILHICPGPDGSALVYYDTYEPRVVVRTWPVLASAGAVILFMFAVWSLVAGGQVLRSAAALVAGALGILLIQHVTRRQRPPLDSRLEMAIRSDVKIPSAELPELVRHFFDEDHQ